MPSIRLLQPASGISTHFCCDNCGTFLDRICWMQCKYCKVFDLCSDCSNINYDQLPYETRNNHQKLHPDIHITQDCLKIIFVQQAEIDDQEARKQRREREYERIIQEKTIDNDYDMSVVLHKLAFDSPLVKDERKDALVLDYYLKASQRNIRVLSLDGGGVRGYMPVKILSEFIMEKYLPTVENFDPVDPKQKELYETGQTEFIKQFDYFVGTSTGALIAFCLAINYNILNVREIYAQAPRYFKKNFFGPWLSSKYDPSRIHHKIEEIIDQIVFPGDRKLSAKNATLLDVRNLLNPNDIISEETARLKMYKYGNYLEFVDTNALVDPETQILPEEEYIPFRVKREKVLLITAYNTTENRITIFNTSYSKHWGYRIADVLKAAMAAPIYFPPQQVYRGIQNNGQFFPDKTSEMFIDGAVFANDPELAALWAIRMQWRKSATYNVLCIGTGSYSSTVSPSTWGGYIGWILNDGLLLNTLLDATRSFTEIIGSNLAKVNNIRRMKLNYKIMKPMSIDDFNFTKVFDEEWEHLKHENDYKAFVYFYNNYILGNN